MVLSVLTDLRIAPPPAVMTASREASLRPQPNLNRAESNGGNGEIKDNLAFPALRKGGGTAMGPQVGWRQVDCSAER